LLIQQVTKAGVFSGSNKLKHLVDAMGEMRREDDSTYINFTKNRNGIVDTKVFYQLSNNSIRYGSMEAVEA
jgi:predicted ATP-dependent serine protease